MFQMNTVPCTTVVIIIFFNVFTRICYAATVTVNNIVDVVEGSETRITCNIGRSISSSVADPFIIWSNVTNGVTDTIAQYQSGLGFVIPLYRDRFSLKDTILVLANTSRSESGTYQYLYQPVLSSFATPVTEGGTVEMSCFADANPSPTYTFLRDVFTCICYAATVTVNNIVDVVEGSETRITCNIGRSLSSSVTDPFIIWSNVTNGITDTIAEYQGGLGFVIPLYRDRFSLEDTTLVLANTSRSESGTYQYLYQPVLSSFATPVTEGGTVEMSCFADANPSPTYTFLRDGEVQQSGGSSTFTVQSVSRDNDGSYECRASNNADTETSESRTLVIYYAPEISQSKTSNIEVSTGDTVSIRFNVVAKPTANYVWKTTPATTDTDKDPETYTFAVSDNIGETYTVTVNVSNKVGAGQSSVRVTVVVPQKYSSLETGLVVGMTFLGIFIGILLSLSAFLIHGKIRASKAQESKVTSCNMDQQALLSSQREVRKYKTKQLCSCIGLFIPMIMFQSNAVSCTVGIVIFNVFICTCYAVTVTVDDIGDVVEGSETRITCNFVRSNSSSVLIPFVTWNNVTNGVNEIIAQYQGGVGYVQPSYRGKFTVERDTTLVIADTLRNDSGTFQCIVVIFDDPPIRASDDVILSVIYLYPPELSSFTTPVTEGDTMEMSCSADANPPPTYTYLKDGEVQQSGDSSIFTFQSVSRDNDGSYECRASNNVSTETSESRTLVVYYAPEIPPSNMEVLPGDNVTIRFHVVASPTANYVWTTTPATTDIDNDPETYTFTVSDNIGQTYIATLNVSNEVGASQSSVKLTVVALVPTSTSVAFTCATALPKCSSLDTSLVVGMMVLVFFIGILLSSSAFVLHGKIVNSKAQETETTSKNVKPPAAYLSYRVEPTAENKTYADLQWINDNPVVYVNVEPKKEYT
ncbi:uncharacterized protein LOC117104226 [Anneissia japonica]|uniref:uncharacterized protein LOC117104226 n=1 Tax=Anneissia japonica TaxID=1529436 RepID=UPI0014256746|nr:uncharacterized protein LOC117104226 [Anneissia japonica]